MSISENDVWPLLDAVSAKFSGRHQEIGQLFKERFRQLREVVSLDQDLSEQRQLLIGAYFVSEFSVESAALFNPDRPAFQGTIQAIARSGFPRSGPFRAATTTNRSVFRLRVLC